MNLQFNHSQPSANPHPLRAHYLESLPEAQELFLELQICKGNSVDIIIDGIITGYAIIGSDNTLLEFFLPNSAVPFSDTIFSKLIDTCNITRAYVKSFDALALASAASCHKHLNVEGFLYRDSLHKNSSPLPEAITVRTPTHRDIDAISRCNEEVFSTTEEIEEYVNNNNMHLFFRHNELVGFAIHARVIPERPEFDIGMLVSAPYRMQGFGKSFLSFAAEHVLSLGGRPTMGCAADNLGSRRCIESLGYIAKYRMFQFVF